MTSPYLVPVARIRRAMPATLDVEFDAPFDENHEFAPRGPAETDVWAEAPVHVRLRLESIPGAIVAAGEVSAPWHGVCRRCSAPVEGMAHARVRERFVEHRPAGDEESYLYDGDVLDLAPLARDAVLLELPIAPLCSADCRGLCAQCGTDRNEASCDCAAPIDPRWAMLEGLEFPG